MINYRFIKNAFAVAGIIFFGYILASFLSGSHIQKRLIGTWDAIEICDEITFSENNCIHDNRTTEYKVRGNKIILSSGEEYKITLTKHYLQLDKIYYLKR